MGELALSQSWRAIFHRCVNDRCVNEGRNQQQRNDAADHFQPTRTMTPSGSCGNRTNTDSPANSNVVVTGSPKTVNAFAPATLRRPAQMRTAAVVLAGPW